MKRITQILLSLMLCSISASAQPDCGTDMQHQYLLDHNPSYVQSIKEQTLKWLEHQTNLGNNGLVVNGPNGPIYEIPVVFHIMHTGQTLGSTKNPTNQTIANLVAYMNQAYEATWPSNPNTSNGGVYVPIRFKLAQRTPQCTSTNGINRVNASSLPGYAAYGIAMSGASNGAPDVNVKALSIWPNTDYINIWIVTNIQGSAANGGGVAGYAYFPGAPSTIDGIVLRADQTDWAIVHEMGHSLGLYHTFQGSSNSTSCPVNNNCNIDGDMVCDTDPHALISGCTVGTNACTNTSNIPVLYNIMNYSSCPDRFTIGQKNRMLFSLLNYRLSLTTSLGALPPGTNPNAVAVPAIACIPPILDSVNNIYDVGPNMVSLANMSVSSGGYSGDNYSYYVDYTAATCLQTQSIANLLQNSPYTITVNTGYNPENVVAWIDFNNNGVFENNEKIMTSNGTSSFEIHTATFTVPNTNVVYCTPLRMRVTSDYAGSPMPTACSKLVYGQTEDYIVIINKTLNPTITISASSTTFCLGSTITFTANATNTEANPTYQWKKNGLNVGTNSTIYSASNFANGDIIKCEVTTTSTCAAIVSANSNNITLTSNATITPTVSIVASATTICAGTSVSFTATPTSGGTAPSYQWKKNGTNIGTNSPTYTASNLTNGDIITCKLTSNAICASATTATSSGIIMVVNPAITPTVSIAASATTICAGTSVTFTATPTNGGTAPSYQWEKNGTNVGTNSPTYTASNLTNGDIITCKLTSNAICTSTTTATSSGITMVVNPALTPTVSIAASATTICTGTSVTFTATPTNGGTAPGYQWKKNGTNVGTNSPTYTASNLTNGNIITCKLTSNAACASATTATSSGIIMVVNPALTPTVSVAASATTICAGTGVTFTATPTNGGTAPSYQWKKNGTNVGTTSPTYTASNIVNADVITCVLTSNAVCASATTATSSGITMVVNPALTPTVSIAASATTICAGTSVTFTAMPTNGGTVPSYQWKKNGTNVGTTSATYTTSNIANADVVTCELTSNNVCASTSPVSSSPITIVVDPILIPTISITASETTICAGTSVTFTATDTNGGTAPMYQWEKNGVNIGINSPTYSVANLANADVITCELTGNGNCIDSIPVNSNAIPMIVNDILLPSVILTANPGTTVIEGVAITFTTQVTNAGSNPGYEWFKNNQIIQSIISDTYTAIAGADVVSGDVISVKLKSNETCAEPDTVRSNPLNMQVTPVGISIIDSKSQLKLFPNPNDGRFILKGEVAKRGTYTIQIINILGQEVYRKDLELNHEINTEINLKDKAMGSYYLNMSKDGEQISMLKFSKIN